MLQIHPFINKLNPFIMHLINHNHQIDYLMVNWKNYVKMGNFKSLFNYRHFIIDNAYLNAYLNYTNFVIKASNSNITISNIN